MRRVFLLVFLFPFVASAAQSNSYSSDMPPFGMPAAWFSCKTSDDCTLIQCGCGFSLAVNAGHKADAGHYADDKKLFPQACIATPRPFDDVACENGVCVGTYAQH